MHTSASVASLLLLFPLAASPARAEISVDSSDFLVDVFAGVDENGDGNVTDDEADLDEATRSGVLSFSETLHASTRSSEADASQTSNVSAAATTLSLTSNGSCAGNSEQGAETTQGDGSAHLLMSFTLTARARLSLTGSIDASEGGRLVLGVNSTPLIDHEVTDAVVSIAEDVVLDPGSYSIGVFCSADTHFDANGGRETASASWTLGLTLTEGEDECQDELLTWIGGRDGAFEVAANWDPPKVPLFEEDGSCDTALVEGGRDIVIDLDAPALAAAAAAPAPIRRVNRFVVDASQTLRPVDGTIEADSLSPVVGERSLELRNGASLRLDGGAVVARHAAVGAVGEGAIEVVGARGLLETTGRLGLGVFGSGNLLVSDGATVISAEAVLGESEAQGSARVEGEASTWSTGNIAVGLEDDGVLEIEAGGQVTSDEGVIGFNLEGDERGRAAVRGKTSGGTPSKWKLDALDVRPRGSLRVEDRGRVEIGGALEIGAEGAEADCLRGLACVAISDGQVNANGVVVGASGAGELEIGPAGVLAASGAFSIGDVGHLGSVIIRGPSQNLSTFTDLVIAPFEGSDGQLALRNGARLDLLGRFRVGEPAGSTGDLILIGDDHPGDTLVIAFDGSGLDSVVGAASDPQNLGSFSDLRLDHARLELSGAGHDLVIQKLGTLRTRAGELAIQEGAQLVNRGRIRGDLVLEGDYVQEPTGQLQGVLLALPAPAPAASGLVRAAATAPPPPPFEPVVVTGDATLAGKATLQFGNGVAPKQGDVFELLQVEGDVTGAFDEVEIAGLAPGFDFDSEIVNGALVLTSQNDALPLPHVNLSGKPTLVETKKGAKLKLTRTGDTAAPLTVAYSVGGTATSGVDFVALAGTIEFPARKKSVTLLVQPIADPVAETSETIEIELAPNASFAPGLASQLTIELLDGNAK